LGLRRWPTIAAISCYSSAGDGRHNAIWAKPSNAVILHVGNVEAAIGGDRDANRNI
jgi:hypothetical protein